MRNLRIIRNKRGLTGEELGKKVGVQKAAISKYELGQAQPSQEVLVKLSEILECSVDYLLGIETDNPSPPGAKSDDIQLDDIEFALFGEVRELDDEDKEEILKDARRLREYRKLQKQQKGE